MNRLGSILLAAASLALASPALADPTGSPADPAEHRHLGFYLNLATGVGSSHVSSGPSTSDGGSNIFDVAVGGALTENLILAGHVWVSSQWHSLPQDLSSPAPYLGTHPTTGGLGAELRYYFMPANVFVAITPSLTSTGVHTPAHDSMSGVGAQAAVGKEWWIGAHWGLGVVGTGFAATFSRDGQDAASYGAGLALTATYN